MALAMTGAGLGSVAMSKLRMDAYYYGFGPTGVRDIDLILCAVASAGKAYHHTEQWGDETEFSYENCEGINPAEWIQNAANKAAKKLAFLKEENDSLTFLLKGERNAVKEVSDMLVHTVSQRKWISVKDRLPKHGELVLATFKDCGSRNQIIVGFYYERFKEESHGDEAYEEYKEETDTYYYHKGWYEQQINWGEYAAIYVNEGDVTHWQPLPAPPGE